MTDILTITLNPALDFATATEALAPESKLRCEAPAFDPGGGGINVARAIQLLGGQASALIAIGGQTGAELLSRLAMEGVRSIAFQGPGETRQSVSVITRSTGQQYRFVMPGPEWGERDVDRALQAIDRATAGGALVVLSGSQPPGVAKDFPAILSRHVAGREAGLIVDTSGPALRHLAEDTATPLFTLRMDDGEAEDLAGRPLPTREDTASFARELVDRGAARNVIVARGADGSVLANDRGAWHAKVPEVETRSLVGAGDSFVGAYVLAVAEGATLEDALTRGVAAAGAAVTTDATELCRPEDVAALYAQASLTRIGP